MAKPLRTMYIALDNGVRIYVVASVHPHQDYSFTVKTISQMEWVKSGGK